MQARDIPQARHSKSKNSFEMQIDWPESKKLAGKISNINGTAVIKNSLVIV